MTPFELTLALLALLITPGPTNAVLAVAGAQGGFWAGLRLIPVVVLCYLGVVTPLALWGAPLMSDLPLLQPLLTGLAALWVAYLAYGLWHRPAHRDQASARVTVRQTAVTTLLNPKSLIFGLVLIPASPMAGMMGFALLVPLVSALWVALGAGVFSRSGQWLNKGAAIWLALLSILLAAKAFAG
jgi:threonine/homoserine/homoserine lactone efflux protein